MLFSRFLYAAIRKGTGSCSSTGTFAFRELLIDGHSDPNNVQSTKFHYALNVEQNRAELLRNWTEAMRVSMAEASQSLI
jgi:hypothetical protein